MAAGAVEQGGAPLFRFGVVADPQYADAPMTMNRHYRSSLGKLGEAVRFFNGHELEFVVTLGDTIDHGWENYDAVLSVYDGLRARRVFVLGNHDFQVAPERLNAVPARLGLRRSYYDFSAGGYRFVVVDGAEVSAFSGPPGSAARSLGEARLAAMTVRGEANAKPWNGGMSEEQFAWLGKTLARAEAAGEPVLLLGHFPVHPFSEHAMWDSARFIDLVTRSPAVTAYFNGHDHVGNYAEAAGKHFVNFRGMVETENETAYALVEVHPDRIEIIGRGTEPSRTLRLAASDPASNSY